MDEEVVPEPAVGAPVDVVPGRDALLPNVAPPPVPPQRSSHVNAAKLASERVVIAAPMSLAGSAARIWKLTGLSDQPAGRIALGVVAVLLIACAWTIVLAWYVLFGLLLVPYRLIRRGQRQRKREALMHHEQLAAIEGIRARDDH
jgi:hypothetical protein